LGCALELSDLVHNLYIASRVPITNSLFTKDFKNVGV
jgi:hypothetical protein